MAASRSPLPRQDVSSNASIQPEVRNDDVSFPTSPLHSAKSSTTASLNHHDTERCDAEKADWDSSTRNNSTQPSVHSLAKLSTKHRFQYQYNHVMTDESVIVHFDGDEDPYNPRNWPFIKKCMTTLLYGLTTFAATWASAIYSSGNSEIAASFGVTDQTAVLGTALLIFGFGAGPMLFSPVSEMFGRKIAILPTYLVAIAFTFGTATAKDVQTVLVTRFFTGLFASAPITCSGGALSDVWNPVERGTALQFYALTVLGGPTLAPIVGAAIISHLGWRWLEYITGIMMMTVFTLDILFLKETYHPALLVAKASRLRHESGNYALHAKHEEHQFTLREMSEKFLIRPVLMLLTPILLLMSIYASFVYGLLYLTLGSFPIIFESLRGWSQQSASLAFLALFLGIITGAGANLFNNIIYARRYKANGDRAVPEARLYPMMLGSILFAAGLFLLAWTSQRGHWVLPMLGIYLVGISFITLFQAALNYIIDTFQTYAASAVAATTFLRSMTAGAFPLAVGPMYRSLGAEWAGSLLGFIALAMIPIPYLFFFYGKKIRSRGKYTKMLSSV